MCLILILNKDLFFQLCCYIYFKKLLFPIFNYLVFLPIFFTSRKYVYKLNTSIKLIILIETQTHSHYISCGLLIITHRTYIYLCTGTFFSSADMDAWICGGYLYCVLVAISCCSTLHFLLSLRCAGTPEFGEFYLFFNLI